MNFSSYSPITFPFLPVSQWYKLPSVFTFSLLLYPKHWEFVYSHLNKVMVSAWYKKALNRSVLLFDQYKAFETANYLLLEIVFSLASLKLIFLDLCSFLWILYITYSLFWTTFLQMLLINLSSILSFNNFRILNAINWKEKNSWEFNYLHFFILIEFYDF